MTIGDKLKRIRMDLGMTQEKFAEHLGFDRGTLANYEYRKTMPTLVNINKILRATKMTYEELMDGVDL